MPRRRAAREDRTAVFEREVERLTKAVRRLEARLAVERDRVRRLEKGVGVRERRERVLMTALGMGPRSKVGAGGHLAAVQESVVSLQEYLLRTSERIDNILTALKEHREFLVEIDKRVLHTGTRDRIRLELDIMKNILSILALAGVDVDDAIVKEIDKVRAAAQTPGGDIEDLRRTKEALDKRFDEEMKRFDLGAIWAKRREIPGYR